jgi:fibronectin-binding autotransporter adhesin
MQRKRGRAGAILAVAAVPALSFAQTTYTWNGGSSDWSTSTNWTPSGVPGAPGDFVDFTGNSTPITALYDYTGTASLMSSLTVDTTNFSGGYALINMPGDTLMAGVEYVGYSGGGYVNQTGGTNNLGASGTLYLGYNAGSTGYYALNNSTAALTAFNETIGYNGAGSLTISSGTNTVSGTLTLAANSGSTGTLYLNRGVLTANEIVVNSGGYFAQQAATLSYSTFNQTGGSVYFANSLSIDGGQTYNFSGGTLSLEGGTFYVGDSSLGNFNQTGGSISQNLINLYLGNNAGSTGNYTLSGTGTLAIGTVYVGDEGTGIFNQSAGANGSGSLLVGMAIGSTGTYILSGTGSLAVEGETIAESGRGLFNQSGGTNNLGAQGQLFLAANSGSTGTYVLSNGSVVTGNEYVGESGSGIFNQSGGSNNLGTLGLLLLGESSDSTGTYVLSNGTVASQSEIVGDDGAGIFNQSGGTNTVTGTLNIAESNVAPTSTYTLQGGTLSASAITLTDNGQFTQTGGSLDFSLFNQQNSSTATFSGSLTVDNGAAYNLSGGLLNESNQTEYVGYSGRGSFTQSGGVNNVGTLYLGYNAGSTGTYVVQSSNSTRLTAANAYIGYFGDGTLSIQGGTNTITGTLTLAANAGASGSLSISSGLLNVGAIVVNPGASLRYSGGTLTYGVLNQTGGTADFINSLAIDGGDTYNFSGGTLGFTSMTVGVSSVGNFNQPAGTLSLANATITLGLNTGSTGTYSLSGGSLSCGEETIGSGGVGIFNQSDGMNNLGAFGGITLGVQSGSTGTYILSNGTLTAQAEDIGDFGAGVFNQSGGTNAVSGTLSIQTGNNDIASGYNLQGGLLSTNAILLQGNGNFAQSGGTLSFDEFSQSGGTASFAAASPLILGTGETFTLNGGIVNGAITINSGGTFTQSTNVSTFAPTVVNQTGGGVTLTHSLTLDAMATYNLSGGVLIGGLNGGNTYVLYVGNNSTASFNQSGGSNFVVGTLALGYNAGASGTYILSGAGLLGASAEVIGYSGSGNFNQSGGTNTVYPTGAFPNAAFSLGENAGSTGTYTLSGGSLAIGSNFGAPFGDENIGVAGVGVFNQTGGSNTINGQIGILRIGASGTYLLSGTGLLDVPGSEQIDSGGFINQSGGTNELTSGGTLYVGDHAPNGTASYVLSGAASLTASTEYVGYMAPGNFTQTGGTHTVLGTLTIGFNTGLSSGIYSLQGGSLTAGNLLVNSNGNVAASGGSITLLSGGLVNAGGSLTLQNSATLDLTGSTLTYVYGTGSDPISAIAGYLASGYNGGGWNGAGIISSTVASLNASQSALVYSVGYADGADGITNLSSGEIEIMPTLAGDAKMQGNVVFGDFQLLSQYFGQSGTSWDEGNFTYGSTTNFGDFQLLSQNFGASASALTAGELASLNNFAGQFGEKLAANADGIGFSLVTVPEPMSAGLLACAAGAILLRRRSQRTGNLRLKSSSDATPGGNSASSGRSTGMPSRMG